MKSFLIAILLLSTFAAAQSYRGSIRGTVTDPSGAVIPNATVTATSLATDQVRTVQSSAEGSYVIAELPAGLYKLEVKIQGFAYYQARVDVAVGLDTTQDAQMRVTADDVVEVNETTAPLVEETRDVLGQVIENRLVVELPLNGRDFGKLVALTPGVTVEGSGVAGTEKGFGQFNINGNRDRSNNYMLDGTDNNDPFFNNSALNQVGITGAPASLLPIDAIQEFNLQSQYAAEYGRNSGAAVNVLTKSGTNHLHGSVFYFLRNSALDARNYFNPAPDPKGAFKNNQYGASLGGPLVKDKTFFFAAFDGQRERVTSNYTLLVPTALQISDAQSYALANGVAPSSGLTKLLNYFPAATGCSAGGTPSSTGCLGGSGTFGGAVEDKNDLDNGIIKIDHYFTQSEQFSARYAISNSNQVFPLGSVGGYGSGSRLAAFAQTSPTRVNVASGSLLSTLSPSLVNELRFGYSRYNTSFSTLDANVNPLTDFGLNMGTGKLGVPEIDFGGLLDNIGASAYSIPRGRTSQTYQLLDNFTMIRGLHTFKFGAEFRRSVIDNFNDNLERGLLTLDTYDPNGYDNSGNPIGPFPSDPVEQLLTNYYLGFFDYGFNADTGNTQRTTFNNGFSFFAQDDWRIRKNLTLNLGLRWEYFGPLGETHNLLSNLGSDGLLHMTSQPYKKDWNNFGPRIGLAWNLFNGTVVRAGYGIYYDYVPQNNLIANYTASAGLATNPIGPKPVLSMDYNQGAFNGTAPGTPVFTVSTGPQNIFAVPQNFATPYTQSWNLNIQQELGKAAALQVGYVGSKGTRLTRLYDANQDFTNPNYNAIDVLATISNSTYHALQTTLNARSWKGLSGFANYTWSKSLDDASDGIDFNFASAAFPQNSDNPVQGEHGASTFDTRHRFTGSLNYEIPTWHAAPAALARGWQLNTIATLQSGRPIPLINSNDTSGTYNYHQRPNIVPGVNPILPNWNPATGYLNPLAFQQPADGTFGNMQRDSIYGPHYTDVDFSLTKTTPLSEHMNLQFRAEFFNIFNHTNFALPNGTITPGVNADGTINTSAGPQGQITQTPDVAQGNPGLGGGGPRVIQFGLRLQF